MKSIAQEIEVIPHAEGCTSTVPPTLCSRLMMKISEVIRLSVASQFVFNSLCVDFVEEGLQVSYTGQFVINVHALHPYPKTNPSITGTIERAG